VSLGGIFSMVSGMKHVAPRGVSMVCRFLMIARVVMFGRFPVVAGGLCEMF
jgi:hypothetical protein